MQICAEWKCNTVSSAVQAARSVGINLFALHFFWVTHVYVSMWFFYGPDIFKCGIQRDELAGVQISYWAHSAHDWGLGYIRPQHNIWVKTSTPSRRSTRDGTQKVGSVSLKPCRSFNENISTGTLGRKPEILSTMIAEDVIAGLIVSLG